MPASRSNKSAQPNEEKKERPKMGTGIAEIGAKTIESAMEKRRKALEEASK